jgi:hypothetical protein
VIELPNRIKAYTDCRTRKEFEDFMFVKYIQSEIIKCSCHSGKADSLRDAYSHYQHCNYYPFCHAISRALDWSEKHEEVKADGMTTNGIPSKTKVLGILPNEL